MNGICRFCLKTLYHNEIYHEITEKIRQEFEDVTQTELVLSESQTIVVCDLCLRSLQLASCLKKQLIENQKKFMTGDDDEEIVNLEPQIKPEVTDDTAINFVNVAMKQEVQQETVAKKRNPKKKAKKKNEDPPFKIQNVKSMQKLECDICCKFYSSKKTLREHQMLHFRKMSPDYKCDVCSKTFMRMKTLRRHKLLHDPSFAKVAVSCPICDRRFQSKPGLHAHMLQHKEPRYKCDLCCKFFYKKFSLQYHMETFHLKERNFQCPYCSKTYIKNSHLVLHVQAEHENKKYYCKICNQDFRRRSNCREHILMLHPDVKPEKVESLIKE